MAGIDLISRKEWGARAPKGRYDPMPAKARGVKIHYTGGHVDPRTLTDHSRCVQAVRDIQRMHMDGNGWLDIGYSFVACAHRKVFVGRGLGNLPAANGPGLNSGHYAVLVLVGTSGVVEPTDGHLHAARDAIDYIRASGRAGSEIKGHRDGYPTSCPGDRLYAWVRKGAPRPSTPAAAMTTSGRDDDMPKYTSLGASEKANKTITSSDWAFVNFDTEYADQPKDHVDEGANPSFLNGAAYYSAEADVTVTSPNTTGTVQVRFVEVDKNGKVLESATPGKFQLANGQVRAHHFGIGHVSKDRKLRLQVKAPAGSRVTSARLRMVSWAT